MSWLYTRGVADFTLSAGRRAKTGRDKPESMKTCRLIVVASLVMAVMAGEGLAETKSLMIGRRDGGQLLAYVHEALAMMRSGYRYRIIGDQYSAAAMQVLYIESRDPSRICATAKAKLHFHLGRSPQLGNMKKLGALSRAFIGPRNLKRLGKLPKYGEGFKTVKASAYVGLCRSKTIDCNVAWCGM